MAGLVVTVAAAAAASITVQLCCHIAASSLSVQDCAKALGRPDEHSNDDGNGGGSDGGGISTLTAPTKKSPAEEAVATRTMTVASAPHQSPHSPLEALVEVTLELVANNAEVSLAHYEVS